MLDFLNSGWAWISAMTMGVFHAGSTLQRFRQVEADMKSLEPLSEDMAAIKADLEWIKDRLR